MRLIVELLILSKWIMTVIALPSYNSAPFKTRVNRFDLLDNHTTARDDNDGGEFYKHKRYQLKSAQKCQEYVQAVAQTMWILPLSEFQPMQITMGCKIFPNSRVFGGDIARPDEFPHMATIGWLLKDRSIGYYCGGSLISDRWILTAAHCTHGPMGEPVVVRLGSNQLSDKTAGKLIEIERTRRHPDYSPPSMYADLALLKLVETVIFESSIKPACLHTKFNESPSKAWVTGWGFTNFVDGLSDVLIKAKLDLIDNVRCTLLHNFTISAPRGIVPSMLCAGDPNGGWKKDTCKGDSGGPLQTLLANRCLYEIVGITSFGKFCANPDLPGVYTRVSHYVEWIESIVWPEND